MEKRKIIGSAQLFEMTLPKYKYRMFETFWHKTLSFVWLLKE